MVDDEEKLAKLVINQPDAPNVGRRISNLRYWPPCYWPQKKKKFCLKADECFEVTPYISQCIRGANNVLNNSTRLCCKRTRTPIHLTAARAFSTEPSEARTEPYTIVTEQDGIRNIFLNDPKKRNALSLAMLEALRSDLMQDSDSQQLRAVIISAGGPVFSSGHNLKELTPETGRAYHERIFDTCSEVMMLVQDLPVPVIAQVQGLATAAGCQLVASCDIAIASDKAQFATPGVNVGLFCSTPGVALGRAVPRKLAMEMLFTGHPISAEVALQHGLVSRIVPHENLEEETMAVARRIVESSRSVIALGKACFNSQITKDRNSAYSEAGDTMVENLTIKDGQEGIQAFVEKRKPTWDHTFDKKSPVPESQVDV